HRFLRHLSRTRLLLHVIDAVPLSEETDPVRDARAIVQERRKYDPALYRGPPWLVLNKVDLLPPHERDAAVSRIVARRHWRGPVFAVSALTGEGCDELVSAVGEHLAQQAESATAP